MQVANTHVSSAAAAVNQEHPGARRAELARLRGDPSDQDTDRIPFVIEAVHHAGQISLNTRRQLPPSINPMSASEYLRAISPSVKS